MFQVAEFGPQQIFHHPFLKFSPASSAFPIPSLLGAGPTACKDESEVNWAQSDIEEEEELEEIALEPDFNYSTCPLEGKFKADYPARRLHTKTDASTFGHLVPNDPIAVCMTPLPSSRLSRELGAPIYSFNFGSRTRKPRYLHPLQIHGQGAVFMLVSKTKSVSSENT